MPDSQPVIPPSGRVAGLDFGTVRIGVALTDPGQRVASPLDNYTRRNRELDGQYFQELCRTEQLVGWVVGLPVHMSGSESGKSQEARHFGKNLQELTDLPVTFFDERFSSLMAEQLLQDAGLTSKQRKARRDKLAAWVMLAAWLESDRSGKPPGSIE